MMTTRFSFLIIATLLLCLLISVVAAVAPYWWIAPQVAELRDSTIPRTEKLVATLANDVATISRGLEQRDLHLGSIDAELVRISRQIEALQTELEAIVEQRNAPAKPFHK